MKTLLASAILALIAADANAGRWLSRDPIEEDAGFVLRAPVQPLTVTARQLDPRRYAFRGEPNLYGSTPGSDLSN